MTARRKLIGFAATAAIVFAAALAAGAAIDPSTNSEPDSEEHEMEAATSVHETSHAAGLGVADGSLRLVIDETRLPLGETGELGFRIVDGSGETVEEFEVEHERRMHLIVVRRDFAGFQHLHPDQFDDGSWSAELELGSAGVYRVFADFATAEGSATLAGDVFVAGRFEPEALPAPSSSADAGDGYEVALETTGPRAGGSAELSFRVSRDGQQLDRVEPYLGASGHLVALREHDQAFLHVHPEGEAGAPGPIGFRVSYPTAGRYRLYLQFKHKGEVRTAAFTQEVEAEESGHD